MEAVPFNCLTSVIPNISYSGSCEEADIAAHQIVGALHGFEVVARRVGRRALDRIALPKLTLSYIV